MNKLVKVWKLGKINYANGLKLQKYIVDLHNLEGNHIKDTILLLEHDPVYTIGIRRKDYNTDDEIRLKKLGADFYKTNRGGLITFHGPGQLIAYPIINLKNFKPSIRWYVDAIERTVILACDGMGLEAHTSPHTGVWIQDNKVCAVGVHCSRYITSHGLALNCNVDMSWYGHIVPCGIPDKGVTSLSQELHRDVAVDEVVPMFLESFAQVFDCNFYYEPVDRRVLNKIFNVL